MSSKKASKQVSAHASGSAAEEAGRQASHGARRQSAQLVVIGAGPGGYAAAFAAADHGLEVTLIDPAENPGGVCLYRGCIPSKALLHAAKVITEAKEAAEMGIGFATPTIDLPRLRAWKEEVVGRLTGGLGQLAKQRQVRYLRGTAAFRDSNTLRVEPDAADPFVLEFEHAILATGSRPVRLAIAPAESERVWDSRAALSLQRVPTSLLVVGGGYIGLELGSVYAALGARVTVVEMLPTLLPGADRDLVTVLSRRVQGAFHEVLTRTKVAEIKEQKNGLAVRLETEGQDPATRRFDAALISVGRTPVTRGLGLENTGVRVTAQGFVEVDRQRRTADACILAIGDLTGQPMLAHKATHEGRVAADVIAGRKAAYEPRAMPAVVFTDPEIAWCGLTETQARARKRDIKVARFPWAASGRAATLGRGDGLTKIIMDPSNERVLGVGIVGPGAGELIAEGVLGIEMAAVSDDIRMSIHPHPTLSETIMEAADLLHGESTHYFVPRRRKSV